MGEGFILISGWRVRMNSPENGALYCAVYVLSGLNHVEQMAWYPIAGLIINT